MGVEGCMAPRSRCRMAISIFESEISKVMRVLIKCRTTGTVYSLSRSRIEIDRIDLPHLYHEARCIGTTAESNQRILPVGSIRRGFTTFAFCRILRDAYTTRTTRRRSPSATEAMASKKHESAANITRSSKVTAAAPTIWEHGQPHQHHLMHEDAMFLVLQKAGASTYA